MTQDQIILSTIVWEAIFWLGAYVLIVRRSFREKIHCMPVAAMCGNIAWEYILGVGLFPPCPAYWANCPDNILGPVEFAAAVLDTFILYTILRYARAQFRTPFIRKYLVPLALAGVALAFAIIHTFMAGLYTDNFYGAAVGGEVPDFLQVGLQGGIFTGWGLALSMSMLFLAMFVSRRDLRGQSFYIALFMLLGNLGAFLFNLTASESMPMMVYVLAIPSMTLNAAYAVLVYIRSRSMGLNPLRRI